MCPCSASGRGIVQRKLGPRRTLNALSGYHTCPACCSTCCCDSGLAGSAGTTASTVRVSTTMTPSGMPCSRARPVTTVLAHLPPTVQLSDHDQALPLSRPRHAPAQRFYKAAAVDETTQPAILLIVPLAGQQQARVVPAARRRPFHLCRVPSMSASDRVSGLHCGTPHVRRGRGGLSTVGAVVAGRAAPGHTYAHTYTHTHTRIWTRAHTR
jgi:hypothetical protein